MFYSHEIYKELWWTQGGHIYLRIIPLTSNYITELFSLWLCQMIDWLIDWFKILYSLIKGTVYDTDLILLLY